MAKLFSDSVSDLSQRGTHVPRVLWQKRWPQKAEIWSHGYQDETAYDQRSRRELPTLSHDGPSSAVRTSKTGAKPPPGVRMLVVCPW